MTIPFVDLDAQYRSIAPAVKAAIDGILESKDFIHGKSVERFCQRFSGIQRGCAGSSWKANGARPFSELSIGISVIDTTREIAIAMATVSAWSRNS